MGSGSNAVVDWRLARETHRDLQIVGRQRTNLLLMGAPGATGLVLEMLGLDRREPVLTWRPGQPLVLPPQGRAATLILHDVGRLTSVDQQLILRWLDYTAGGIRVVSTTTEPLWPRVQTGTFNEVLYYRLNTVCLSAASQS
jgi:Sigma-54 interaction domain